MAGEVLGTRALNRALLARQGLLARAAVSPLAMIEQVAGLQAQDPRPPFVNLWSRLADFAREDLTAALTNRQVVRVTLMRGTLTIVSAADYLAWRGPLAAMLEAGAKGIQKNRGVSLDTEGLNAVARPFFAGGARRFEEVRETLVAAFPEDEERAMGYTVRMTLPLVTPPEPVEWAFRRDPKFALAKDWLGADPAPGTAPDAMLLRYLAAFGPATVADAQTWSGLGGLKAVFERLAPRLIRFKDDRKRDLWDLPDAPRPDEATPSPPRLLDAFDVVVLGHAERARIIDSAHKPLIANCNLRVPAVFLMGGFAAGTWTSTIGKRAATLELKPFAPLPASARSALAEEARRLLIFLAPEITKREVRFVP